MLKLPLANYDLIVQASTVSAFQVPNVKAAIFEDQRTVVPADQRTLQLKVAVLTAPDNEFRRVNIHRARPSIGNVQCYFHHAHHPSELEIQIAAHLSRLHQCSCYDRSDIREPAKVRVPG